MRLCGLYALCAFASLSAIGAQAHHSFAAIFDSDQPLTISGTVTDIDWRNPHMHFTVQVETEDGALEEWRFEGFPPNMLVRQGWQRDVTMRLGDKVIVTGWQARLEPYLAAARQVTFEDGRELLAGPPAGTGGR